VNILWLFDSLGLIFGPLVFLAGITALFLCYRATHRAESGIRKTALIGSLTPFAVGICAAVFGIILFSGKPGGLQNEEWLSLGKACLAGLVVTAIPLVWSLMLFRRPGVRAA
jgi:hypothetical protein